MKAAVRRMMKRLPYTIVAVVAFCYATSQGMHLNTGWPFIIALILLGLLLYEFSWKGISTLPARSGQPAAFWIVGLAGFLLLLYPVRIQIKEMTNPLDKALCSWFVAIILAVNFVRMYSSLLLLEWSTTFHKGLLGFLSTESNVRGGRAVLVPLRVIEWLVRVYAAMLIGWAIPQVLAVSAFTDKAGLTWSFSAFRLLLTVPVQAISQRINYQVSRAASTGETAIPVLAKYLVLSAFAFLLWDLVVFLMSRGIAVLRVRNNTRQAGTNDYHNEGALVAFDMGMFVVPAVMGWTATRATTSGQLVPFVAALLVGLCILVGWLYELRRLREHYDQAISGFWTSLFGRSSS